MQEHDFYKFMDEIQEAISHDFERVSARSREDPGTAGDQVEEMWADVLRSWLPPIFTIVTKGRLLFPDRSTSPQVDIIVLKPSYPIALQRQKYFFSGGVIAIFECKLNLRRADVKKAFLNCARTKSRSPAQLGTPFRELNREPLFGLLSHSHNIFSKNGESLLYEYINKESTKQAGHCSDLIDVFCIASEASITLTKDILIGSNLSDDENVQLEELEVSEVISTMYVINQDFRENGARTEQSRVLGGLIYDLTEKISRLEPSVRDWVSHLSSLGIFGGIGLPKYWTIDELSSDVRAKLREMESDEQRWSTWSRFQ